MNLVQKLRSLHDDIAARVAKGVDPLGLVDDWALAERLLLRMPVDLDEADRVFKARDLAGLDVLIARLEAPPKQEELPEFPQPELDHALKLFRKRLKLQRLADESRLGGRYTSGGRSSKLDAITPPEDVEDPRIWKVLVRAGKLKDAGQGFYAEP